MVVEEEDSDLQRPEKIVRRPEGPAIEIRNAFLDVKMGPVGCGVVEGERIVDNRSPGVW